MICKIVKVFPSATKEYGYQLTLKEKRNIIDETNFTCLFLFEYYLSQGANSPLEDKSVAMATGINATTVRNSRLILKEANLFHQVKVNKEKIVVTYLGKQAVLTKLYFDELFGGEKSLNKIQVSYKDSVLVEKVQGLDAKDKVKESILKLFGL